MKILTKLFLFLAFLTAFSLADTTAVVAPVKKDSTKAEISAPKKQAVWIKLEGDVDRFDYLQFVNLYILILSKSK